MEINTKTTVGALLTEIQTELLTAGAPDRGRWCMVTAGAGAYQPETPCLIVQMPDLSQTEYPVLPAGMNSFVTDELLYDVTDEYLTRGRQGSAEILTEALEYYLVHDTYLPHEGKSLGQLDQILRSHQWTRSFAVPRGILAEPSCDLSIALEIFYLAGGYAYLDGDHASLDAETLKFLSVLHQEISAGKYQRSTRHYSIPLTKIQRYKLEKKRIPVIFYTDL